MGALVRSPADLRPCSRLTSCWLVLACSKLESWSLARGRRRIAGWTAIRLWPVLLRAGLSPAAKPTRPRVLVHESVYQHKDALVSDIYWYWSAINRL